MEGLRQEISDLTESLHTTRMKVDALRRDREESKRMLKESRLGTTIGALQDILHRQDDEPEDLRG